MAAPRLAMAGKQLAQPIADAMLPSKPALSAARDERHCSTSVLSLSNE
jgi:hypothetical protein